MSYAPLALDGEARFGSALFRRSLRRHFHPQPGESYVCGFRLSQRGQKLEGVTASSGGCGCGARRSATLFDSSRAQAALLSVHPRSSQAHTFSSCRHWSLLSARTIFHTVSSAWLARQLVSVLSPRPPTSHLILFATQWSWRACRCCTTCCFRITLLVLTTLLQ